MIIILFTTESQFFIRDNQRLLIQIKNLLKELKKEKIDKVLNKYFNK